MIILLLILLALVPGCSAPGNTSSPTAEAAAAAPAVAVESAKVESRELQRKVESVGTLDPNEEVTVSNQVEGPVAKILVDIGDAVRAGQLIAQLDTRELELAVRQQEAALQQEMARLGLTDPSGNIDEASTSQVRQAEATFAEARLGLDRAKRLAAEGVMPKQQLDQQQARYDVAEAAVRSARETVRNIRATIAARKTALELSEKKLADAQILAPIAGLVKERQVSAGAYLKANSPVITLVQTSSLKLHFDVPETAIDAVRTGGSVQFVVDSFPEKMFEGKISRISPAVNQQSRTLRLEAAVNNAAGALKPGLFARVTILTDRRDKALVVPASALFTFAGLEKLFVIENGKVAEHVVRSGSHVDNAVEIVAGVKEGDVVATSNLGNLQQGREVSVR